MLGRQEKQEEMWAEPTNLLKRIPEDNQLRKMNAVLKLDFVREEVRGFYGKNGQVSVDPVILMKMMLLLFLDDVASERELMRVIPLRIDYLWFLGYGLDDEIPNHSVLSKARKRWGTEVFESLFSRTVEQCLKAGLIDGKKLHMDSSLVRADASLNSVVQVTVAKLDPEKAAEENSKNKDSNGPVNGQFRSTTDPESTLVSHASKKSVPSYKVHRAIDDQCGVITAVKTTTGSVDEGSQMLGLVAQHQENVESTPKAVIGDSKYGTSANFMALAEVGIRSHMADLRKKLRNPRQEGIYPAEKFIYEAVSDTYRCPARRKLRRHHFNQNRGYFEYRTQPGTCDACRLRSLCTRAKMGRTLKRYLNQELLDRARTQSHGPTARKDRVKRKWLMEGNFAMAAVHHGLKRARWRGLWKQSIQDLIIAAVQNLKTLFRRAKKSGPSFILGLIGIGAHFVIWLRNIFHLLSTPINLTSPREKLAL